MRRLVTTKSFRPFSLPIIAFALAILAGGTILCMPISRNGHVGIMDNFFIATSAVSVTGLAPFDIFTEYNRIGQMVVLILMQLGGLGIITFTTIIAWLTNRRISLADRVAIEQGLFYNPQFSLAAFIKRVMAIVFGIEATGAIIIYALYSHRLAPFEAIFLSVSAFCNAGFAPWPDSLDSFRLDWAMNIIIMALITCGGLGFFVLHEILALALARLKSVVSIKDQAAAARLSWLSQLVIQTSLWLVLGGAAVIFILGCLNPHFAEYSLSERILTALFESVTCRTAGFASTDQTLYNVATLYFVTFLMFIGGSPCSCAGGVKTTTFRILAAMLRARILGRDQAAANGRAFDRHSIARAFLIFFCAVFIISSGSFLLILMEQAHAPAASAPAFFAIFFETVSAFCTVGLSLNLTPSLSDASKIVLCILMFMGKLGPIWLISALQRLNSPIYFKYPEENVPVG